MMETKKPVGRPRVYENRTSTTVQLDSKTLAEMKAEAEKQNIPVGVLIGELWDKLKTNNHKLSDTEINEIKADAVIEFVNIHVGAFESGFTERPVLTLAELHRTMQHHVWDNFNVKTKHITEIWGESFAEVCGFRDRLESWKFKD